MKRLLGVVVVSSLLVAASAASGQADAVPTCQGQPASMVGEDRVDILGTDGDDVIISGGSESIEALGGDDLVCAAGNHPFLDIDAGPGEDVVDTTASPFRVVTDLGAGATGSSADRTTTRCSTGTRRATPHAPRSTPAPTTCRTATTSTWGPTTTPRSSMPAPGAGPRRTRP